ncbi:MAG: tRNA (adenosine(37)-N6)-threonylcarbamoyltransferase complex ATPase subunit type 1 TsaE [Candidatus Binatia bacterium]|nr:tRNA (adenosine(37)-N6)-threonylcarbamoyltransferase complex ATPase subunit type 1 TsaE [Candidatus Binatia bacterium]
MAAECFQTSNVVTFVLENEGDTRALGWALGQFVGPGDRIALCGNLGAGKTTLVRGVADGVGCGAERVRSPTFTLVNEYLGGRLPVYHVDFYRLDASVLDLLALREVLYGDGVALVEWWDRVAGESCHLRIDLEFLSGTQRNARLTAFDRRYQSWIESLQEQGGTWR